MSEDLRALRRPGLTALISVSLPISPTDTSTSEVSASALMSSVVFIMTPARFVILGVPSVNLKACPRRTMVIFVLRFLNAPQAESEAPKLQYAMMFLVHAGLTLPYLMPLPAHAGL